MPTTNFSAIDQTLLCLAVITRRNFLCICTTHMLCKPCYIWQTWEQEFAWAEGDKPVKLAAKALTVPHNSKLSHTPIFCFETMLHMLYWTCLVYDYKRVGSAMPCTLLQVMGIRPDHTCRSSMCNACSKSITSWHPSSIICQY